MAKVFLRIVHVAKNCPAFFGHFDRQIRSKAFFRKKRPFCPFWPLSQNGHTHSKSGKKMISRVPFEGQGTSLKRSPTPQKSEPASPRTRLRTTAPSPLDLSPLLPPSLVAGHHESIPITRHPRNFFGAISSPRPLLLRSPPAIYRRGRLAIKDLNPVAIACDVRQPLDDIGLSVNGSSAL